MWMPDRLQFGAQAGPRLWNRVFDDNAPVPTPPGGQS
ncbi:hypothetical protein ANTHELSMS3_00242 [Antarctobacter heliothermus]|uniref:Uncharacterized protein n=1 Tax=Antarctobacter heliothermus TaxID=74033 RepID=A0A222DYD5_9RHOB|nr:hypothetical protein ANTHELSMS3_00242 [Antarctobacter heliothermus]